MDPRLEVLRKARTQEGVLHPRHLERAGQNQQPVTASCLVHPSQVQEHRVPIRQNLLLAEVDSSVYRLKEDRASIDKDREVVKKNMRKAD